MRRKKTSKKQDFSFQDMPILGLSKKSKSFRLSPSKFFEDHHRVGAALLECLEENDTEAFIEILDAYLQVNRTLTAKRAHLSRSTVQQALSKKGNPTLKTLAKIVHKAVA